MYSQHFGLTQDPFSIAPDPRYLFMSERHREALAHLLYGVAGPDRANSGIGGGTGGGFVLLTGDIDGRPAHGPVHTRQPAHGQGLY